MRYFFLSFLVFALFGCEFEPEIDPHNAEESVEEVKNSIDSEVKKDQFERNLRAAFMECNLRIIDDEGTDTYGRLDRNSDDGGFGDRYVEEMEENCPFLVYKTADEIVNIDEHPDY